MGFIAELKRRNVFRVGIAYLVLAWVGGRPGDRHRCSDIESAQLDSGSDDMDWSHWFPVCAVLRLGPLCVNLVPYTPCLG